MRKSKILLASSCVLLLSVSSAVVSNAWFIQKDVQTVVVAPTSAQVVSLSVEPTTELAPDGNGGLSQSFQIDNQSSLDTYMRLDWIPYYVDADENPSAKDVSGVSVSDVQASLVSRLAVNAQAEDVTVGGMPKNMILLLDPSGNYLVVPAETSLQVTLTVTANDMDSLRLLLRAEAIQATSNAAEAAGAWGWDSAMAKTQASGLMKEAVGP
ncbi:MAG: hypothetical protein FWF44_01155 [Defluviitaleaceae bacterium]|nr:hypothetical protein [Defluviitaleaceae bacterium]